MDEINKINLSEQTKFWLSQIIGIEDYFHQVINQRKSCSKKLSKYVTTFDYLVKILIVLTLFRMGIFGAGLLMDGGGQKVPLPKICHTHPTMMKLGTVIPYLKKIQKIYESRDTPLSSADISIFSPEISKFCYIKKYRYRLDFDNLHNFQFF